jgi:hypothetical protein
MRSDLNATVLESDDLLWGFGTGKGAGVEVYVR